MQATARVPTAQGSKYLQQLCKHWSHSFAVEFDATRGTVTFPRDMRGADYPSDGVAAMTAEPDTLLVAISGGSAEQIDRLKQVVAAHLDRFAFREAPLPFAWEDVPG